MIPRSLQIKNFLSYGTDCPTITFDDHPLICLSGNNGHGKSALLDAMTWAVWGCARKISTSVKADHGLLRLGHTGMRVVFDFTVNNNTYRIKREFEIVYGKPKATLDLGLMLEDGSVSALTEKTLRDTQTKIEAIIGLDYETFVNSACIRQGNANEFSKRSPKERKDIIATILGLSRYDALKRVALEKSRPAQQEMHTIQSFIEHTATQQTAVAALLDAYPAFTERCAQVTAQLTQCKALFHTAQHQVAQYDAEKQNHSAQLSAYLAQEALYVQGCSELKKLVTMWRNTRATQVDQHAYALRKQELQQVEQLMAEAHQQFATYAAYKEHLQRSELACAHAAHALEVACAQFKAEQRVAYERFCTAVQQVEGQAKLLTEDQKRERAERATHEQTATQQRMLIQQLTAASIEVTQVQKLFDKRKELYHRWTTLGNVIRQEQGLQLARLNVAHDVANASCPLCEQSLSAARKRFLHTKIEGAVHKHAHTLERFKRILPRLKELLVENHAELQRLAAQKTELHTLEHANTQLFARIAQLKEQEQTIVTKLTALAAQKTDLATQKEALAATLTAEPTSPHILELRGSLNTLHMQRENQAYMLQACVYDEKQVNVLRVKLAALQRELAHHAEHQEALATQHERKKQIRQLCAQLKMYKKQLVHADALKQQLHACTAQLATMHSDLKQIAVQIEQLRTQQAALLIEQGKFDAARATREQLQVTAQELEKKYAAAQQMVDDYTAIAAAAGKDGIQALLIEEALPEIEDYANHLLAKLTNNMAHIIIESLRDLKSGGTKETLDIKISDTFGVRPYELFSGGEAFRIDIALRIALSKLLANRAGTALQLLIIDEGFGSQDDEGLAALVDVLHALREDFAQIIVVSHLPTMKDQFPVHFHVEKGPQGSVVRVIEQG